jgi:hypothetical protein
MNLSAYVRQARKERTPAATPSGAGVASAGTSAVELSRAAVRLLLAAELAQRIRALPAAYPHILNKLADLWSTPADVERYLEELLLTARAGRQGFPPAVVTELTLLREKNRRRLPGVKQDVWLQAMLR